MHSVRKVLSAHSRSTGMDTGRCLRYKWAARVAFTAYYNDWWAALSGMRKYSVRALPKIKGVKLSTYVYGFSM